MASIRDKLHLDMPIGGIQADADDFHVEPGFLRPGSHNWLYRNGRLVTRPGLTPFAQDTGSPIPLGAISFQDRLGQQHIIHATTEKWWRFNTATNQWDDISAAGLLWSGTANIPVTFRVFNSGPNTFLLGTNAFDTPRAWDTNPTTNDFTLFGGSAPVARCIAILRDRVLLGNLSSDANGIDVSAFQDHTTGWGVTQTATLLETPGFIIAMQEINPTQVAVYKQDSVYLVSGTTGLAPFRFDLHVTNISGPINPRSVVPISSSLHAVFTLSFQLCFFDGNTYAQHPTSDRVRILFEQSASKEPLALAKSHAYYDRTHNELRLFYVQEGDEGVGPRDAIVVNLNNNSVWKEEYPIAITMSYYGSLFVSNQLTPSTLLGHSGAQCYLLEGDDDDGVAISVDMETGLSHLGDPTRVKTIEETEHYFGNPTSTQTPAITLLTSESGKDPTVSSSQALSLTTTSTGPYVTGHRSVTGERITSRFVGLKIQDASVTAPLEYRGSSITVVPRGSR